MPNSSAQPARQAADQHNPPAHNGPSNPGQALQQQVTQALQPALAQLQEQMTRTVEQQFEPLRARLQDLTQQQLTTPLSATPQQQARAASPARSLSGQAAPPQQKQAPAEEQAPAPTVTRDGAAPAPQTREIEAPTDQEAAPAREEEAASREIIPAGQGAPSALQQWGENLETAALMVLALGEVLEGIALLLQAVAYSRQRGAAAPEGQAEAAPEREGEKEATPGKEEPEEPGEGGPSLLGKISEAASRSVSSLKDALSHVTGDGSSERGALALQQWSNILEHASTLVQALGDAAAEQRKGKGSLASMGKWMKVYRKAHALADEVKQTFGDGWSSHRSQREPGVFSKAEHLLGKLTSSDDKDEGEDGESSEASSGEKQGEKQGGVSSALKALTGRSSSKKSGTSDTSEGEGGGLLDALTGEDSPLQALREFSKRQQGPGGLAPKGPIGRKPPPGPLRRDRLPGAKS